MSIQKLDGDKVAVCAADMVALQAAATLPSDCDVRTILLDVVPGDHGMGQEVYARNVEDVERVLNEMSARLSFESRTVDGWQPPETAPVGEEILVVATLYSMIYPEPRRVVAKKDSGNSWWAGPIPLSHVTKWMHLPEVTPCGN